MLSGVWAPWRPGSRLVLAGVLSCVCACPDVSCPGGASPRESEAWFNATNGSQKRLKLTQGPTLKLKTAKFTPFPFPGLQAATTDDVRLCFTGKGGGFSAGLAEIAREDTGPFDARATLSVDSIAGLGEAEARIDLYRPPDASGEIFSVGVRWDDAAHGLVAFAKDASGEVGTPITFALAREVDVRIEQTDTDLTISARDTPPAAAAATSGSSLTGWAQSVGQQLAGGADGDGFQVIHTQALPVPETPFEFALACKGLDPGGRMFFDFLRVEGPQIGGATERPLMDQLTVDVTVPLQLALLALDGPTPDFPALSQSLGDALTGLDTLQSDISAAQQDDTLQASTQAKRAHGALTKAAKRMGKAIKLLDAAGADKLATMQTQVQAAFDSAVVATANLAGFKGGTLKQLPIELVTPP